MKMWRKKTVKFIRLPLIDKYLMSKALICVCFVKLGLVCLPFKRFRACFHYFFRVAVPRNYPDEYVTKVVWSIKAVSGALPFSVSCLPQALATKYMLRGDSLYTLKIGVNVVQEDFCAHAWVEKQQQIIIGDTPLTAYVPIWIWE